MTAHAAIHVGLKQLGIEGEDARDLYERLTAKRSLREMTPREHEAVVGELRRLGFRPGARSKTGRSRLEGRFARKLQALWIAAWNLGIVTNRDDRALLAFVKRQTGIDHVRFLRHPEDAAKAIEALKSWMAREAGVAWRGHGLSTGFEFLRGDQGRVAWAQWRLLNDGRAERHAFHEAATRILGRPITLGGLTPADWQTVMNALGEQVRAAKTAG